MNAGEQHTVDDQQKAEYDAWVQEQLKTHVGHLAEHGIAKGRMRATIAWALPGRLCLSRAGDPKEPGFSWWVISGAVATDHIARKQAATPREAARHFALKWQLQAARLEQGGAGGADFGEISKQLAAGAELLYALSENDAHWSS